MEMLIVFQQAKRSEIRIVNLALSCAFGELVLAILFPLVMVCSCAADAQQLALGSEPKGVILVLIDDIGYGDIDELFPSSLATPSLDALCRQSVCLTDFHVGTTCAPTRASIMTGRSVNAGGVWHTIAGRELLREDEQTMAEVFRANGWTTGIFGKWHLGEGYPFSPRFRGFDVAVIHGGGGVGQGPDFWGNDYYSGIDGEGSPAEADTYFENGKPIEADRFCTDYWFSRARQFIGSSVRSGKPFFCYLPTNAAHSPFNAPHGAKRGFDGLIENIDDNMAELDEFLESEGIKDDVLFVFTCDNGTAGKRLGGLRGAKGSHYDGGHNVPCFLRWKNGGIAGTEATKRNVNALTAGMDLLPTFIDLLQFEKRKGGRPLQGMSLKRMLLDSAWVPTERTVVVDTQRGSALEKWKRACVMRDEVSDGAIVHKWRLTRATATADAELYDFLVDRATTNDVAVENAAMTQALSDAYESWWTQVADQEPFSPFVVAPDKEPELTLFAHSWIGQDGAPWHQQNVLQGATGTGTHAVRFDSSARYRFELRRWPREDGGAITTESSSFGGKAIEAASAQIVIAGVGTETTAIEPGASSVVFEMDIPHGPPTTLTTAFIDAGGNPITGAYYVYVREIGGSVRDE